MVGGGGRFYSGNVDLQALTEGASHPFQGGQFDILSVILNSGNGS
jgi:hypothetical protein